MKQPSQPPAAASAVDFRIAKLKNAPESLGLVVVYLSRMEPFTRYAFGAFSAALRQQIGRGEHLAAVTPKGLVGYCGWLPTTTAVAEAWVENKGPLLPAAPQEADAVALTVVAAPDRKVIAALLRQAREENPKLRVFFKRDPAGENRPARKTSVQNVTGANDDAPKPDA